MAWANYWLEGVASLAICLVGVVVNGYAVHTLVKQRVSAIFHKLMLTLVIYDLLYVSFTVFTFSLSNLSPTYESEWL